MTRLFTCRASLTERERIPATCQRETVDTARIAIQLLLDDLCELL